AATTPTFTCSAATAGAVAAALTRNAAALTRTSKELTRVMTCPPVWSFRRAGTGYRSEESGSFLFLDGQPSNSHPTYRFVPSIHVVTDLTPDLVGQSDRADIADQLARS